MSTKAHHFVQPALFLRRGCRTRRHSTLIVCPTAYSLNVRNRAFSFGGSLDHQQPARLWASSFFLRLRTQWCWQPDLPVSWWCRLVVWHSVARCHHHHLHPRHLLPIRSRACGAVEGRKYLSQRPTAPFHWDRMGNLWPLDQMAASEHHHTRHLHLLGLPKAHAVESRKHCLRVNGMPCIEIWCRASVFPASHGL